MPTIKRGCSYKIITRALQLEGQALVAILLPNADDCEVYVDQHQLQTRLDANDDAIIVYNQHVDAIACVAELKLSPRQIYIEIRQDTKGVLGLHAIRKSPQKSETLELIYAGSG